MKRYLLIKGLLIPFCCLLQLKAASRLPQLIIPETSGVNIHFTAGHQKELDLIRDAGFRWVRMDFVWSATERVRGCYDWSAYEALTHDLRERGLGALYILDYSNSLYEEQVVSKDPITKELRRRVASPRHPESVAAFARWAQAAAVHFRDEKIIWEVWNEPNIHFWAPEPNVNEYLTLLTATVKAIRQAVPDVTIVAPASSGFPWEFLETLFRAGVLRELDGVSVHPYRAYHLPPESVVTDYLKLRALIDAYTPVNKDPIPILSGEWGYATPRRGGLSLERQAAYLVRQQLVNLWAGIPLSIWYDWKDDGTDPDNWEHHFGTVTFNLEPKPSYRAFQHMTRLLTGYEIVRRLPHPNTNIWLLLCRPAFKELSQRTPILIAWTTGAETTVELPIPADMGKPPRGFDLFGAELQPQWSNSGHLQLRLNGAPQYWSLAESIPYVRAHLSWRLHNARPNTIRSGRFRLPITFRNLWDKPLTCERLIELDLGETDQRSTSSNVTAAVPPGAELTAVHEYSVSKLDRIGRLTVTVRWKDENVTVAESSEVVLIPPVLKSQ